MSDLIYKTKKGKMQRKTSFIVAHFFVSRNSQLIFEIFYFLQISLTALSTYSTHFLTEKRRINMFMNSIRACEVGVKQ